MIGRRCIEGGSGEGKWNSPQEPMPSDLDSAVQKQGREG